MKINNNVKTILIIIAVIAVIVIGANIISNSSKEAKSKYGQLEAQKEISGTLDSMASAANKIENDRKKLEKAIGEFTLRYVAKDYSPIVTNVKALEMDNYGRWLYYVTVNMKGGTRYYYVVIYDIDSNNATFKYTSSAVLEDAGQTAIHKQYAKDYNNWNKPLK